MFDYSKNKFDYLREKHELLENKIKDNYFLIFDRDSVKMRFNSFDLPKSVIEDIENIGCIEYKYKYIPAVLIKAENHGELDTLRCELEKLIVEKEYVCSIPEDILVKDDIPRFKRGYMWNLEMIEAYEARELNRGQGITVAVIDTGCDYEHPEIAGSFDKHELGYNFVNDSDDPFDDNGHGTHTGGTIAGREVGVASLIKLKALKFLSARGSGSTSDAIKSFEWCIEHEVDITSNSWGAGGPSVAMEEVINEAHKRGMLTVSSAGNSGGKSREFPAQYENVMSIPAVDRNEKRAYFSTIFKNNDVCAPGVEVLSSVPGNMYATYSGTSMSCPHVAGVAAVVMSKLALNNEETRDKLISKSKPLGNIEEYGQGLVKAWKTIFWPY